MFFRSLAEELITVPDYYIDDILYEFHKFNLPLTEDERKIFGDRTVGLKFIEIPLALRIEVNNLSNYVISQQIPILKNLVPQEIGICSTSAVSTIDLPNRYINRIGEQIVIPLKGQLSITSEEFNTVTFTESSAYRFNNRTKSTITASSDFLAVTIILIDFDLKKHLLPHDLHSVYPRQIDEYLDPTTAIEAPATASAY